MLESIALVDFSKEKCPRWQHVSVRQVRKAAARIGWRRAISASDLVAANDDVLGGSGLGGGAIGQAEKGGAQTEESNKVLHIHGSFSCIRVKGGRRMPNNYNN